MSNTKKTTKPQTQTQAQDTKKITQYFIDVTFTRQAPMHKTITNLSKLDKAENYANNYLRTYLEILLYDQFIKNDEIEETPITLKFTNEELFTVFMNINYILGVTNFTLEYNKADKMGKLSVNLTHPYGQYRETLEKRGLVFNYQTKEEQQQISTEQMEIINEVNSILSAYGLKTLGIND